MELIPETVVSKVQLGSNEWEETLHLIRSSRPKPFLGGFRTPSMEYHNGSSQTDQKRTPHCLMVTRESQTYFTSSKSTRVLRESATQCAKEGLFVDGRTDREVMPMPYFDSEMWMERRSEAALYIQRLTRGWFARKLAANIRKLKYDKLQKAVKDGDEQRITQQKKHKEEIERRRNPKTKEDFDILYNELEVWRLSELERIKNQKEWNEEQRKRALKETLDKEIDLLQTIDRLKISASRDGKTQKIEKYLRAMSDPKQWGKRRAHHRSMECEMEVHTPFTIRAKELMDLYKGLRMRGLSTDERLDVLLNVKWTVKEWDCNLTQEIVELIDREANMLDRGRPEKSLEGLRVRLANLFLQFIEYPLFNPEAARFQKIPYEISELAQKEFGQSK